MLRQIRESDDDETCKSILATVTLAYRPLTPEELVALTEQLQGMNDVMDLVEQLISHCGSLLVIRTGVVYFFHQSAKDFILSKSVQEVFPLGMEHTHHQILARSVDVMSRNLYRDMWSLTDLDCPIKEVTRPHPDPLAESCYSCVFWIDHLCNSSLKSLHRDPIYAFLKDKYLHWLGALSLQSQMSEGAISMAKLISLFQVCSNTVNLES